MVTEVLLEVMTEMEMEWDEEVESHHEILSTSTMNI